MSTTKTRRKSKAAAADDTQITLTVPEDIDLDVLSNLLPDMSLESPSVDTILALYRLVLDQVAEIDTKQQGLDEARAESEKKDVELDQALQDRETLSSDLDTQIQSLQDELKQVKQERDALLSSQSDLQNQISRLSSTSSASSGELDDLKHRLQDSEREKRDLMGVVSRLKQDEAQRDEEIQSLRKNLKEARHEHQELENQLRELRSTDTSSKFKLDSMTQQLQLAQAEVERVNAELVTKSEEFTKYRRTKQAELATLQANYDSTLQTHDSTQASYKALQSAHTSQTHQLTQALTKVHDLSAQIAEQEAVFNNEANGLRRLVSVLESREKQAKEIVDSIEKEWEEFNSKMEREGSALKAEAEREKKGREEAEKKLDHLQTVLDKMGQGELPLPGRLPGTPLRGFIDESTDGMMGLSPTVAIASRAQKTGKTFTEVYADYVRLQEDFSKKCLEYDHMDRTLIQVLAQIEERAPILSQQRSEYERLQSEATQLASQLAQAISDRDSQASLALENSQKLTKVQRENNLLQQQLDDLGRQVQNLLREIGRRDDPTLPADEDLGNVTSVVVSDDVDSMITNNLVLFKSIDGLQEQNKKLLKIVRELGRKMETEEREYREAMEREQGEAVREAHEVIQELAAQLERQKKSSDGIIQTYVKERDALKSVIARMESGGSRGGINGHSSGSSSTPEITKDLAEIQTQFDTYRAEMGVDTVKLREDLASAHKEVAKLQADVAKEKARSDYYNERLRINQEDNNLRARDLEETSKRNQQLFDQWTRADIECGRLTEDLQVSAGRIEQLRNECANLRAEKKIWEGVQARLVDENKTLALERGHLSDMMSNIQKMNNDNQRSGESDRRRLESQLQLLEGQVQDNRSQLAEERDNVRRITLQKEIEARDLQSRLDKANQELAKTRESLVGAETSKKHLEQRVEDLTKYFESNKEKLAVYERRGTTSVSNDAQSELTKEQQLETEVAELSASLKVAERDLERAKERVAQFESIAKAAEEALGQLHSTHDQYKLSTDETISRHESTIQGLEEKLSVAHQEATRINAALTDLQSTLDTERAAWLKDKNELEGTIIAISTSEKTSESDRTARENEVRNQEQRVRDAEERYQREVVSHAEAIKTVSELRSQLNTLQASVRDNSVAAETATAKLASSEQSWAQQKEILDKEIAEQTKRYKELQTRNKDLLLQFEDATRQAARARQSVAPGSSGETQGSDGDAAQVPQKVVDFYRDQNSYLEVQLETKQAENARLKAQADHLNRELDETRTILSQEREKAVESAASASQHTELVKRIEQLNILRESNATLRAESDRHSNRVKQLEAQLKDFSSQLEPAKEQARVAQAELDAGKAHIARLELESKHWQERNSQLLTKYDRIDPAEMQALQDEITQLKKDKEELEAKVKELEEKVEAGKTLHETYTDRYRKFKQNHDRYKETSAALENEKKEWMKEKAAYELEKAELENKLAGLEAQIQTLQESKPSEESADSAQKLMEQTEIVAKLKSQLAQLTREREKWQAEIATLTAATASGTTGDEAAKLLWEAEKTALESSRDEALVKVTELEEKVHSLTEETAALRSASARLNGRLTEAAKARTTAQEKATLDQEAAVKAAVDALRAELQQAGTDPSAAVEELKKQHAQELQKFKAQVQKHHANELQKLKAQHAEQLKAAQAASSQTEGVPADMKAALETATENGRKEALMQTRVKDSLLIQRQKQLKELEMKRNYWVAQGWLTQEQVDAVVPGLGEPVSAKPGGSTSGRPSVSIPVGAAPSASTSTVPAPTASASTPTASTSTAPAPTPSTVPKRQLPDKALGAPTGPVLRSGAPARGAPRGGPALRGAGGKGRGGAPGGPPKAPNANTMSILGASAKRPRDSEGGGAEDPQAKRAKPGGGPVILKRPPPGNPPPGPS